METEIARLEILRTNGTFDVVTTRRRGGSLLTQCKDLIGVELVSTVNLRDGRVMIIDDVGFIGRKPRNEAATVLYHGVCKPGTTHPICGDALVCRDELFE